MTVKKSKKSIKPRPREVSVDSMARVIASCMTPNRPYGFKEIVEEIYRPAYGTSSPATMRLPLLYAAKNHFVERAGKNKGTKYMVTAACPKPGLATREVSMVELVTGKAITNKPAEQTEHQLTRAADNILNGYKANLPPFKIELTDTDPAREPATKGITQSSVWQGSKYVTDEKGNQYLILTTKIRLG